MKAYSGIGNLITKAWPLLVAVPILGWILGYKFQQIYEVDMYGFEIVLAMHSFALIFAGLIVGYRTPKK